MVKVGDTLKKGQNILEIETDKAVLEVPSASEGVIKEILIKAGTVIKVGQPIFKIEGGVSAPSAAPAAAAAAAASTAKVSSPVETTAKASGSMRTCSKRSSPHTQKISRLHRQHVYWHVN